MRGIGTVWPETVSALVESIGGNSEANDRLGVCLASFFHSLTVKRPLHSTEILA
jgi:hypothetical protein